MRRSLSLFLFAAFSALFLQKCAEKGPIKPSGPIFFVGTYTEKLGHVDGKAHGIYTIRLDTLTGKLTVIDSISGPANPSFLTVSPDGKHVFSVGENGGTPARPFGSVASFDILDGGKLRKINEVSAYGIAPCHISTDAAGRFCLIANYVTGDVLTYKIADDGSLSDSLFRKKHDGKTPLAHQILEGPDGQIWTVDKGSDAVFAFKMNEKGQLLQQKSFSTKKGDGPRHLDFHPKSPRFLAVVNELSSSVWLVEKDEKTGELVVRDSISTLPKDFSGPNSCAEIQWHPSGRFLFASNRGHNSIAIFGFDEATKKLRSLGHESTRGAFPRSFLATRDGRFLLAANQNSSTISVFRVDEKSGKLTLAAEPSAVGTPVCLTFWK